jgi:hypothetical protein
MDHAAHRRPPAEGCPVKPNILEPPIGSCRSHHRTIPEEKIGTLVLPNADRLHHLDGCGTTPVSRMAIPARRDRFSLR